LKEFLQNSRELLPLIGLAAFAIVILYFWLRKKPEDAAEIERHRRAYLNKVGRIVEGQVLEIAEHARDAKEAQPAGMFAKARVVPNGTRKLIHYTYSISGVTYETAQDITGLEERLVLNRVAAGQTASVKYDPSNPSNSILIADDWSGLH
jgi:uncharacterized protein DUF3592